MSMSNGLGGNNNYEAQSEIVVSKNNAIQDFFKIE